MSSRVARSKSNEVSCSKIHPCVYIELAPNLFESSDYSAEYLREEMNHRIFDSIPLDWCDVVHQHWQGSLSSKPHGQWLSLVKVLSIARSNCRRFFASKRAPVSLSSVSDWVTHQPRACEWSTLLIQKFLSSAGPRGRRLSNLNRCLRVLSW